MEDQFGHRISYLRVSVTDRCNERCHYCMPQEVQEWLPRADNLTAAETVRLVRVASQLGVTKLRVTGGEPLTRRDIIPLLEALRSLDRIEEIGLSTNGTLLAREIAPRTTFASALHRIGIDSLNISLDTLNPRRYAEVTGRNFLQRTLDGIDAALDAGFACIKLNCVLMRGKNEEDLVPLVDFAASRGVLLRFIELMPVTTSDVLAEDAFFPIASARRRIEAHFGALIPEPSFRTNGPALYYQVPGRSQRVGFIGAMTDLHFCESCNKLRLTSDGKLRPCLGSYLEFDILEPLRAGADDAVLREFFLKVVERKPQQHDFRTTYQPGRKMVAIGG